MKAKGIVNKLNTVSQVSVSREPISNVTSISHVVKDDTAISQAFLHGVDIVSNEVDRYE